MTAGVTKQVRGSSLLLIGRVLSLGFNLVTQVLVVRTLTKTEYGAFAYALSIAAFVEPIVTLGMHRGASRFLSIYLERDDIARVFGTLILGVVTILGLGLGAALITIGLGDTIAHRFESTDEAVALLSILILMAPVDAMDGLVESGFAVFARPTSIFVRRHIVGPTLRLAVVVLLVLSNEGPRFLSAGFVATGAGAVAFYAVYLYRLLKERGLVARVRQTGISIPFREVIPFCVNLLSVDLVFLFIAASSTLLLGALAGVAAVASYQAVLSPARLNYRIVTSSFTLLFTPEASRLHARGDHAALSELYWQTAAWIAVLSFPVFALTTALAGPVTELLYGRRYASAAPVMAFLAFGYFVNAALGFNSHTLQITGHLATVFRINIVAVVVSVAGTALLASRMGAVGAAIATAGTFTIQNLLNQRSLRRHLGIRMLDARAGRIYARIAVATVGLAAAQLLLHLPLVLAVALAGLVALAVLRSSRHDLDLDATFPELRKVPGLGLLLGPSWPAPVGGPAPDQEG